MCEKYSWIEKDNQIVFLTADDVFNTKRGKELQQHCGREEDYVGHGAIRHYYNFTGGIERECTDFSTPGNFPKELVQAILIGKMVGLGVTVEMLDIFTPRTKVTLLKKLGLYKALAAYNKALAAFDKALAAYDKALAAYDKALAAYNKALAAFDKARAACDKARAACDKALVAFDKARAACDKARAACDKALAAKEDELITGYKKLLKNKKNLRKCWRVKF